MAYIIPTTFTANDAYSAKVAVMSRNTSAFAEKLNILNARIDRTINKGIGNSFKNAGKQLVAFGEAALVFEGIIHSGNAIMDYETELQNLRAVTGATADEFVVFKEKIEQVSIATKKSSIEVAKAFTNVDNNLPQYHKNAVALAEVTKQAVILGKASRMDSGEAATDLTMIMNQFAISADNAAKTVDELAAGQVAGSSKIGETTEALLKFGAAADQLIHITTGESIALVELASKFEKGSEAGTRARNILLDIATIKTSPVASQLKSLGVDLNKISDESLPLFNRLNELSKVKNNTTLLKGIFDKRNVVMATGILSVLDKYPDLLNKIESSSGAALRIATINTDTLSESVKQLVGAWDTEITTSDKVGVGLNIVKKTIQFVGDHMDGLVTTTTLLIGGFYGLRAAAWITTKATFAFGVAEGIAMTRTGALISGLKLTKAQLFGVAAAEKVAALSMAELAVATGGVLLILGVFYESMTDNYQDQTDFNNGLEVTRSGFDKLKPVINDATIELQEFNEAQKDYIAYENWQMHRKHEYDRSWLMGAMFDLKDAFIKPQYYIRNETDAAGLSNKPLIPQKNDPYYFKNASDTSQIQSEYVPGMKQAQTDSSMNGETSFNGNTITNPSFNVYVYQDKAGNWNASNNKPNGLMMPFVGNTSRNANTQNTA